MKVTDKYSDFYRSQVTAHNPGFYLGSTSLGGSTAAWASFDGLPDGTVA